MVSRWFLAISLLVTPALAQAQATLQSTCQDGWCALVTAGTQTAPSAAVQRLAVQLRDAGGWGSIRPVASAAVRWRAQPSSITHLELESWQLAEVHTAVRALLRENHLTAIIVVHAEPDLATDMVRADDIVRVPTLHAAPATPSSAQPVGGGTLERGNAGRVHPDRLRLAGLALGITAFAGASAAWSLVLWSSHGPTPDLIASANAPDLTQAKYDALEARWRHTRFALHATGAASAVLADLALALYGDRLRRWPGWAHWTVGALGLGLAAYGSIDLARTPACDGSDPRVCAGQTYRLDRGAMMLYTAIPLLSEPLIARAWRPRVTVEPSRGQAAIRLSWQL